MDVTKHTTLGAIFRYARRNRRKNFNANDQLVDPFLEADAKLVTECIRVSDTTFTIVITTWPKG